MVGFIKTCDQYPNKFKCKNVTDELNRKFTSKFNVDFIVMEVCTVLF